jgi:hypothetical protein
VRLRCTMLAMKQFENLMFLARDLRLQTKESRAIACASSKGATSALRH